MRFLVVTRGKHPVPPSPELVDAMKGWVDRHLESGQMEQTWNFAGVRGGGGILDVESLDELDDIMTGFPFGPYSEIEVLPLTDLHESLDRVRSQLARMAGG